MHAPVPGQAAAADLVATADHMRDAVRGAVTWRYVSWLSGMSVATVMYFAGLAVAGTDEQVLVVSLAFAVSVAGLSVGLLAAARASRAGFSRRWAAAVGGWGAFFALAMVLGMTLLRGEIAFWWAASVVCAAPLVVGAWAEARA